MVTETGGEDQKSSAASRSRGVGENRNHQATNLVQRKISARSMSTRGNRTHFRNNPRVPRREKEETRDVQGWGKFQLVTCNWRLTQGDKERIFIRNELRLEKKCFKLKKGRSPNEKKENKGRSKETGPE